MEKNFSTIVNETISKINVISDKQLKLSKHSDIYSCALYASEDYVFDMEDISSAKVFLYIIQTIHNSFINAESFFTFGITLNDIHDMNILIEVHNYFIDLFTQNGEVA